MASERIAYYECGNGENPRGWHTGAGMLYWWPGEREGGQYTDWFWPTVDFYRLPGTTVSTKRLADKAGGEWGAPKPAAKWVGGASDGEFAAVGQHLLGLGSTLRARKSWFCVADAVICLGAGISSTDGVPVETIVDNRNLGAGGADGTNELTVASHWAHLAGHGGWVFPRGTGSLRTLCEDRTGAWSDINTEECQAVAVRSLGLTAANFWQPGTVGRLTTTAPVSALVRSNRRTAALHISEPPRTGAPVEITWHRPVRRVTSKDASVEVLSTGRSLRLRISGGTAGATHRCEVALS